MNVIENRSAALNNPEGNSLAPPLATGATQHYVNRGGPDFGPGSGGGSRNGRGSRQYVSHSPQPYSKTKLQPNKNLMVYGQNGRAGEAHQYQSGMTGLANNKYRQQIGGQGNSAN